MANCHDGFMPSLHGREKEKGQAARREPPADWFTLLKRITSEITELLENRRTWLRMTACAERQEPSERFHDGGGRGSAGDSTDGQSWLATLYYRDAALGIRRMVDGDRRTGSFKRLLQKMAEEPKWLAAEWFLGDSAGERRRELNLAFKTEADTLDFGHLNPAVPRADLAALTEKTAGIKCYVDQHITHAQLDPHSTMPTPSDIDAALDLLAQLLDKYTFLLRPPRDGSVAMTAVPKYSGTAVPDATAGPRG
jgi:hypothetical protein